MRNPDSFAAIMMAVGGAVSVVYGVLLILIPILLLRINGRLRQIREDDLKRHQAVIAELKQTRQAIESLVAQTERHAAAP